MRLYIVPNGYLLINYTKGNITDEMLLYCKSAKLLHIIRPDIGSSGCFFLFIYIRLPLYSGAPKLYFIITLIYYRSNSVLSILVNGTPIMTQSYAYTMHNFTSHIHILHVQNIYERVVIKMRLARVEMGFCIINLLSRLCLSLCTMLLLLRATALIYIPPTGFSNKAKHLCVAAWFNFILD